MQNFIQNKPAALAIDIHFELNFALANGRQLPPNSSNWAAVILVSQ